jgi:hypothetical protein
MRKACSCFLYHPVRLYQRTIHGNVFFVVKRRLTTNNKHPSWRYSTLKSTEEEPLDIETLVIGASGGGHKTDTLQSSETVLQAVSTMFCIAGVESHTP